VCGLFEWKKSQSEMLLIKRQRINGLHGKEEKNVLNLFEASIWYVEMVRSNIVAYISNYQHGKNLGFH
jgi:hypothetical protein